jgi:hypothetical protein
LQAFLRAQPACASASSRTDSGLAARPMIMRGSRPVRRLFELLYDDGMTA